MEESIQSWRSALYSSKVDMLGDFAGSELFTIDGDSLMDHHFRIYDEQNKSLQIPTAAIQLIYLVEKFLLDLIDRGATFHIAFIDSNKHAFCQNDERRLFLRTIMIHHLKQSTTIKVFEFASWSTGNEWPEYLNAHLPVFVMISDHYNTSKFKDANGCSLRWNLMFVAFSYDCLIRNISVAFMADIGFRDSKVTAYMSSSASTTGATAFALSMQTNAKFAQSIEQIQNCWVMDNASATELSSINLSMPIKLAMAACQENVIITQCFLLSVVLLKHLPLESRAISPDLAANRGALKFLSIYYQSSLSALSDLQTSGSSSQYYDVVDEKLFHLLVEQAIANRLFLNLVPKAAEEEFIAVLEILGYPLLLQVNGIIPAASKIIKENGMELYKPVCCFENSVFSSIIQNKDASLQRSDLPPFREITHWHSSRELHVREEVITGKWALKNKQTYIRYVDKYARSMTGVKGLYNKSIIVAPSIPQKSIIKKVAIEKQKIKPTTKPNSKKQQIIDANIAAKRKDLMIKASKKLDDVRKKVANLDSSGQLALINTTLLGVDIKDETCALLHWLKLKVYIEVFAKLVSRKENINLAAIDLFEETKFCAESFVLDIDQTAELELVFKMMGFQVDLEKSSIPGAGKSLNIPETKHAMGMTLKSFQLRSLGACMSHERITKAERDPRVPFVPDEWQIKLLDIVDKKQSALICAPTSSGKTFIAYYAMQKVLESNDTDIVVYVAPTKALVNQVAAEVYARFKKTYQTDKAQSVWGIWTRDYRHCALKCQVLITVPEMLGILFLSPQHVAWNQKIKRVIFDEVHCIGIMDGSLMYLNLIAGGKTWENLLRSCHCPILALSATVGNPKEFHQWLSTIQALHGINVDLIICSHRHSELSKKVYVKGNTGMEKFVSIHPFGSLNSNSCAALGILKDLSISASECLDCYDAIRKVCGKKTSHQFDPEIYFKASIFPDRKDVADYERDLRLFLEGLASSNRIEFNCIIDALRKISCKAFDDIAAASEADDYIEDNIFNLATDMHKSGLLPAIGGLYGCEIYARICYDKLLELESDARSNDPVYQAKKAEALKLTEAAEKAASKSSTTRSRGTVEDDFPMEDAVSSRIFDWEAVDLRFSFLNSNTRISKDDVKLSEDREFLMKALERGIGVHHAGMPRKYLSLVEQLMRSGHLTLVFGTGTLAFGINMPCKSVIFVGDSTFLTPLMFRQMSGRAGRRGIETTGNVVFFGMSKVRVDRLLTAELPKLSGHFPLTTSLVLRICLYWSQLVSICQEEKNANNLLEYAEKTVKGLFENSLFCVNSDHLSSTLKHHLQFSLDYLFHLNMIDGQGNLVDLAGIACHLYYMEPSNFAFTYLFQHKAIHQICEKLEGNQETALKNLILVLSHLFCQKFVHDSGSRKILQPLPLNIDKLLRQHNSEALSIFTNYCRSIANDLPTNLPSSLPLSSVTMPSVEKDSVWVNVMPLVKYTARSPFAALSGAGDSFPSMSDLGNNIRKDISIDTNAIPYFDLAPGQGGRLNTHIPDFFSHGQIGQLERDNGLKQGESWTILKEFTILLKSICASLESRLEERNEGHVFEDLASERRVAKAFSLLSDRWNEKFNTI